MAAKNVGGGRGSMAAETKIHQRGMKMRAPEPVDASMRCKGGSVDSGATRESTAPTPKTLGPREA